MFRASRAFILSLLAILSACSDCTDWWKDCSDLNIDCTQKPDHRCCSKTGGQVPQPTGTFTVGVRHHCAGPGTGSGRSCDRMITSSISCAAAREEYERSLQEMPPCYQCSANSDRWPGARTQSTERMDIEGACR